jgi:predicted kinase
MRTFKPCMVALSGLPLHGKTEVANHIAQHTNFVVQDVDEFRRKHFPAESGLVLQEVEEIDIMIQSFRFMMESVGYLTERSTPVILPSTFSRRVFKDELLRFMMNHRDIPARIFRLDVHSESVISARLAKRLAEGTASNVKTMERYRWSKTIVEPWPDGVKVTPVFAGGPVETVAKLVLAQLTDLIQQ